MKNKIFFFLLFQRLIIQLQFNQMAANLGADGIISKIIHLALEKQEITDTSVSDLSYIFSIVAGYNSLIF